LIAIRVRVRVMVRVRVRVGGRSAVVAKKTYGGPRVLYTLHYRNGIKVGLQLESEDKERLRRSKERSEGSEQ
jgi:hypothetical protein